MTKIGAEGYLKLQVSLITLQSQIMSGTTDNINIYLNLNLKLKV